MVGNGWTTDRQWEPHAKTMGRQRDSIACTMVNNGYVIHDLMSKVTLSNTLGHETGKGRLVGGWEDVLPLSIRGATLACI